MSDHLSVPWSTMAVADDPELIATTDGRVPGRRGRATRQRLLECTAELLVATPWRSIKVIDIARQAGTSPATFYQYFENVEGAITVLAEELVDGAGVLAGLVDGDWTESASWDTAVAVVEGFMDYWERNRAVFRVVELTTVEGDLRFQGLRVRALNAVTGRQRPDGRRRDLDRHAGPGGGPSVRLRVLGHPYRVAGGQPGTTAALVGHRPAGAGRGPGARIGEPGTSHRPGGGRRRRVGPHGQDRHLGPRRQDLRSTAGRVAPPCPRGTARAADQRSATGLTGDPSAAVKGRGVASRR